MNLNEWCTVCQIVRILGINTKRIIINIIHYRLLGLNYRANFLKIDNKNGDIIQKVINKKYRVQLKTIQE
jgi:hypothetical protein